MKCICKLNHDKSLLITRTYKINTSIKFKSIANIFFFLDYRIFQTIRRAYLDRGSDVLGVSYSPKVLLYIFLKIIL